MKKEMEMLARDIYDWCMEHDLWHDCCIYFNGKAWASWDNWNNEDGKEIDRGLFEFQNRNFAAGRGFRQFCVRQGFHGAAGDHGDDQNHHNRGEYYGHGRMVAQSSLQNRNQRGKRQTENAGYNPIYRHDVAVFAHVQNFVGEFIAKHIAKSYADVQKRAAEQHQRPKPPGGVARQKTHQC